MKLLRKGMKGSEVRYLQSMLNRHCLNISVDGHFGAKTKTAVEPLQASVNISADGIVGPTTWDHLHRGEDLAKPDDQTEAARQWIRDHLHPDIPGRVRDTLLTAIEAFGLREQPSGSNGGAEIGHIVGDCNLLSDQHRVNAPYDMPHWCAIFLSWSMWMDTGADVRTIPAAEWRNHPFGRWFGGVNQIEDWARDTDGIHRWRPDAVLRTEQPTMIENNGSVYDPDGKWIPLCGMIFTMGRDKSGNDPANGYVVGGHVGFVVGPYRPDPDGPPDFTRFVTIEGNAGNRVKSVIRKVDDMRFFVKWWRD